MRDDDVDKDENAEDGKNPNEDKAQLLPLFLPLLDGGRRSSWKENVALYIHTFIHEHTGMLT